MLDDIQSLHSELVDFLGGQRTELGLTAPGPTESHPLVQQDSQTRLIVGIVALSVWIDTIVSVAGSWYISGYLLIVAALLYFGGSNLLTLFGTYEAFITLIRQAKTGTFLIRQIILSQNSTYDIWATSNTYMLLIIYWAVQIPLAITGTIFLALPLSPVMIVIEQLVIYFLYNTYSAQLWAGTW